MTQNLMPSFLILFELAAADMKVAYQHFRFHLPTAAAVCPTCGTLKSGLRSCCARGGFWFKNCGDPGDLDVGHTWSEGIQACKSKFTAK